MHSYCCWAHFQLPLLLLLFIGAWSAFWMLRDCQRSNTAVRSCVCASRHLNTNIPLHCASCSDTSYQPISQASGPASQISPNDTGTYQDWGNYYKQYEQYYRQHNDLQQAEVARCWSEYYTVLATQAAGPQQQQQQDYSAEWAEYFRQMHTQQQQYQDANQGQAVPLPAPARTVLYSHPSESSDDGVDTFTEAAVCQDSQEDLESEDNVGLQDSQDIQQQGLGDESDLEQSESGSDVPSDEGLDPHARMLLSRLQEPLPSAAVHSKDAAIQGMQQDTAPTAPVYSVQQQVGMQPSQYPAASGGQPTEHTLGSSVSHQTPHSRRAAADPMTAAPSTAAAPQQQTASTAAPAVPDLAANPALPLPAGRAARSVTCLQCWQLQYQQWLQDYENWYKQYLEWYAWYSYRQSHQHHTHSCIDQAAEQQKSAAR